MALFYADLSENLSVSWSQLIEELNSDQSYPRYCYSNDFYVIFKNVIKSLLSGGELVLLDYDFSEREILALTGLPDMNAVTGDRVSGSFATIRDRGDLLARLQNIPSTWRIQLFTSGTTGLPKSVRHTFQSLTRFVKISEQHSQSKWGFAYNPTHIAGLQVFFQALCNGNTIVRLFGLDRETILQSIEQYQLTHISATPTFYRLLLPPDRKLPSVKKLTSGGDKYDPRTMQQLTKMFPNADMLNVYASTEAGTLFAASGDAFTIKPQYREWVKIEANELLIHRSLMGESDAIEGEWYHTGDMVDLIDPQELRFRFVHRKNEMINVGGYKVNPSEVEAALREIAGIKEAHVYGVKNALLGNLICSDVVVTDDRLQELTIRQQLQDKLQPFKIPRIIKIVDKIDFTRSGKLKRSHQ